MFYMQKHLGSIGRLLVYGRKQALRRSKQIAYSKAKKVFGAVGPGF